MCQPGEWLRWERAAGGPVEEAIAAYQQRSRPNPDDLDARWELLRALHFAADYLDLGEQEARRRPDRARELADESLAESVPEPLGVSGPAGGAWRLVLATGLLAIGALSRRRRG